MIFPVDGKIVVVVKMRYAEATAPRSFESKRTRGDLRMPTESITIVMEVSAWSRTPPLWSRVCIWKEGVIPNAFGNCKDVSRREMVDPPAMFVPVPSRTTNTVYLVSVTTNPPSNAVVPFAPVEETTGTPFGKENVDGIVIAIWPMDERTEEIVNTTVRSDMAWRRLYCEETTQLLRAYTAAMFTKLPVTLLAKMLLATV